MKGKGKQAPVHGAASFNVTERFKSEADASVSNTKVTGNQLQGGLGTGLGKTGIVLSEIEESDSSYDAVLENNKVINNRIRDFTSDIVNEGGDTKVHANDRPFTP